LGETQVFTYSLVKWSETKKLYTKFEMDFELNYRPDKVVGSTFSIRPKFKRANIDNYGLVRVEFSHGLDVAKLKEIDQSDLEIVVIPSGMVEEEKLGLKWQVISFEKKAMQI